MPASVKFTRDDIENIALKLDEFATILNKRETTLLATLFYMVHEPGGPGPEAQQDEPLSAAFRSACDAVIYSRHP